MNNKPIKPNQSECCGSGCKPCIFDIYEENLKKWKLGKLDSTKPSTALDQMKYLPFLIVSVENITDSTKKFQFQAIKFKSEHENSILIQNKVPDIDFEICHDFIDIKPGEYLILKGEDKSCSNDVFISRSYTPIINEDKNKIGAFEIIVSLIKNGRMSEFLMKLGISDIVFLRGPFTEFQYKANTFKNILLFGGGTGVVPLHNISKSIVEDDEDETWVNAIYSFKTVRHMLFRQELNKLKEFWNFKVHIYISANQDCDFKPKFNESVEFKKINETVIYNKVMKVKNDKLFIIISGPDGFNKFVRNALLQSGIEEKNIFIFW